MATRNAKFSIVTRGDVEMFDKVRTQLRQAALDFEALSKKSPDGAVSKFKLSFINEKLRDANRFLAPPFKPIEGFEQFDDASLPSNSDVVMVVRQYLACLEQWRSAHVHRERLSEISSHWVWNVEGETIGTEEATGASHREEGDEEVGVL